MARPPRYRSDAILEQVAADVLVRYAHLAGWQPSLPIPVEDIVETVYDLRILWQPLEEQPGETILGALVPAERTIVMNETHLTGRLRRMGTTTFTFAHELGHWLFDADDPAQGDLFGDTWPIFCRGSSAAERSAATRERNCDRFAARLLLPRHLLDVDDLVLLHPEELCERARAWGVSTQTLEIRIRELVDPAGARSSRLL